MTDATDTQVRRSTTVEGTRRPARPRMALFALCMAFFVVQLDATVVNVALTTIRRALGGGLGGAQWVVTGYTIALAAGMLTAGSLGDRLGARRICLLGLALFGLASAWCSFAPSLPVLVAARVAQGAGAAALLPCSLALIVRQFPAPRERARALGAWGGISSVGMAAGPVVGGMLIALAGWRAIFLVNVPFCAVAVLLTRLYVIESPTDRELAPDRGRRGRRAGLDLPGLVCGALALAAVTGGVIEGGQSGWTRPVPLGLMTSGVVVGVAFVAIEHRADVPMMPLRIFAAHRFSTATCAGLIFNFCLYGALLCVSLFLQGPLGQSAFRSGALIFPLTVSIGVGATLSGRLTARLGPRVPMTAGFTLGALGAALLAVSGDSLPLVVAGAVVLGCCSLAMPAMTSVAMSALETQRSGLASGVLNTARQTGGAMGTAVLGALLAVGATRDGMSLSVPMLVVVAAYLVAIGATMLATTRRED